MPCLAHQRAARCGTISVAERGYAVHDAPTVAVSWERHHDNSFAPKGISRNLADPECGARQSNAFPMRVDPSETRDKMLESCQRGH